jgi:hypothetical protein
MDVSSKSAFVPVRSSSRGCTKESRHNADPSPPYAGTVILHTMLTVKPVRTLPDFSYAGWAGSREGQCVAAVTQAREKSKRTWGSCDTRTGGETTV